MEEAINKSSFLCLKDRHSLSITGVTNILGFDPDCVILETSLGRLTVEGEELKIESLDKSTGEITVRGRISGLYYSEEKPKKGVFKDLFK